MEEIVSLILLGCKLARELESNLPNLADQPNLLSKSCDEVIKVFRTAKERLYKTQGSTSTSAHPGHMMTLFHEPQDSLVQQPRIEFASLQQWLRSSCTQAMDNIIQMQLLQADHQRISPSVDMQDSGSKVINVAGLCTGGSDRVEGSAPSRSIGGELHPLHASESGIASSSQRQRRRKDDGERRTVIKVAAPRVGNTEIPPEDDFTWRKYGQKEILGSRFPRSYYRCTHQKLYQCPAKKQVQRFDDDPYTYEVIYRGDHTCHMSSTAPSLPPPPPVDITDHNDHEMAQIINIQPPQDSSSVPSSRSWLSTEYFSLRTGGGTIVGGGAGPSTTRSGKELVAVEYPVTDLADAMFNSGSSSSNSIDFLFHSNELNRGQQGDNGNNTVD
ncbi:hypothetical protein F2P56_017357 [Juglans regia]|uniref:WRKY transcription factor 55-like n=2 Tax=Juglans regia TaxID=51240 RepID=A0A2I4EQS4_JUGRE|nr:WRKY transcription factor 55-like [Juglans regia]KAF5467540.1 hypothetical protein F2P56_017357 [Juglans regia]QWQ79494.1 WRKY72 [Juglans sigillata]